MITKEILWSQAYRPKIISDIILPERLKTYFQNIVNSNEIPSLLLHGPAGIGKNCVSYALVNQVNCDWIEINGSDNNGVDTVRTTIKNYATSLSMSGGRKVIIISEADYFTINGFAMLRAIQEEVSENCSFIYNCNYKDRIIPAIHSRCAVIDFSLKNSEKPKIAKEFFGRIKYILEAENIPYENNVVLEIVKKYFPDFRRTINELQRYSKFGKIDSGILGQLDTVSIKQVIKYIKEKDFNAVRKWAASGDYDSNTIFTQLYESLYDFLEQESIPQAVLILAEYQDKAARVINQEINLVAALVQMMLELEFK
jgi:DNA polymerase III delta prime subunit